MEGSGQDESVGSRFSLAVRLLVFGFVLVFVGVVVLLVDALLSGGQSNVSGGVVIVVGFIPVLMGFGPYGFYAVLVGAVLTVVAFVVFVWARRKSG